MQDLVLTQFQEYLQPRSKDVHKAMFGHALLMGSDRCYPGAIRLAGEAALRVGTGLVSIGTHRENAFLTNLYRPEFICYDMATQKAYDTAVSKATAVGLGPGLGQTLWSKKIFTWVIKTKLPLVIDADGLNLLAKKPGKKSQWILTPHPGEAARLLQTDTITIQKNREAAACQIQKKFGGICVLKGHQTLIIGEDQSISRCQAGNPGMASAGMGDVLTGMITGLLAQRLPLLVAAQLGVLLHALAGDLAAKAGERGLIASDLFPLIRQVINSL